MNKFNNRKSNRSGKHNYSEPGHYFVTICTHNRVMVFGYPDKGKIILNEYGKMAEKLWLKIPYHFTEVEIDEYVVMPNHVHGIIIIKPNPVGTGHALSDTNIIDENVSDANASSANLSVIIGSYKSAVTKNINRLNSGAFKWQRSFYDHRIRTEKSLQTIREYILQNPSQWGEDENNPENRINAG